jgi:hypothetical protein
MRRKIMQKCIVKYKIATYSGEEIVFCDNNDDNDVIFAKCRHQLIRKCYKLPFGYESYQIIYREDYYSD